MATARKLPSGSWRARVFSHKDVNGKSIYESFTAQTKREAELMAAQFASRKARRKWCDLTVEEAIEGYITAKTNVLSPKTIREYRQMQGARFDSISRIQIKKLTSEILQTWISDLAGQLNPKTVGNAWGLLRPSLELYMPDVRFRITLPKRIKRKPVAPPDDAVARLFAAASRNMKRAIALAAFSSLRRSEICALTYADLDGSWLSVNRSMVQDEHNQWIMKEIPKTSESVRMTPLPEEVVRLLGTGDPDERIVPIRPDTITEGFNSLYDRVFGKPEKGTRRSVTFHTLRHYYASIAAVLSIPDVYTADFGGWSPDSRVFRQVYKNKIMAMTDIYARKMGEHFDEMIRLYDTTYDTEMKKASV